ncbi:hypothetical protein D9619_011139 [Psilocybe cf. subviscida]|uniref:Uncharacterized protein n=1 Tax=Psilocybe cf. subviscida TaxID=2480587 RepID=A0A8H5BJB1_9AGAR|nr:hypothetical protein D9619_011139 [Psilocybe cf. subviscida]
MMFKFASFYLFATCALSALAEPLVIRLITSIAIQSKAVEMDIESYNGLGNPVFITSARTDLSMLIANITEVTTIIRQPFDFTSVVEQEVVAFASTLVAEKPSLSNSKFVDVIRRGLEDFSMAVSRLWDALIAKSNGWDKVAATGFKNSSGNAIKKAIQVYTV